MKDYIREDIRKNITDKIKRLLNVSKLEELAGYQNFVYQGNIDENQI